VLALFGVFTIESTITLSMENADTQDYFSKLAVAFIITGVGG
jgi:hypothetical protein